VASDSRTHAGVDNFATFCKMTVFERVGDRVIVLLSSGNLAGTQAVISMLKQRGGAPGSAPNIWSVPTMFDVAGLVADAMRDTERREGKRLEDSAQIFNASFIIGGQIKGESMRLFRTFAEGNFIEAGTDTPFFQTGETKYGKSIIDRVIKCVLLSFDATMRSNLSVGMPIDLACYERDSLRLDKRRRLEPTDGYFAELSKEWGDGVREVFKRLPELPW
jgi:putative proteasome-type protease